MLLMQYYVEVSFALSPLGVASFIDSELVLSPLDGYSL